MLIRIKKLAYTIKVKVKVANKITKKITRMSLIAAGALALASCATGPKIHSVYEQEINFGQYKTFSFFAELEPKGEQAYRTLTNKYLQESIRKELTARGLTEAENSDLLINFHVSTKEKITSTTSPALHGGFYDYRRGYGFYGLGYGSETQVSQYTEGTLTIDVVDAEIKQLVWQGVAIDRIKQPKANELRGDIFNVVSQIFLQYPVAAPMVIQ